MDFLKEEKRKITLASNPEFVPTQKIILSQRTRRSPIGPKYVT